MPTWLDDLNSARPNSAYGVTFLKSSIASLAAPPATFKPNVDKGKMSVTAVLTTRTPDRQGDVIDPLGGDFSEHETNPVVMFHHGKEHKLPIGKAEDRDGNYTVRLVKARDCSDALVGTTHFAQSNRFANDVFGLVAEDVLRGVSIGFDPLSDPDSVEELGRSPTLKRPALHFKGWKLLEYSHTPLGVNRDALTVAVQKALDGSRVMHPKLLQYLRPMAAPHRKIVPASYPTVRKAMDDENDPDMDQDAGAGQDTGEVDGSMDAGFDPTTDDPGMDPDLKGQEGYANPDESAPPPTVQALMDGSQGMLDLCAAIETSMQQSEHLKGRKYAAKLCAELRKTAGDAKKMADKIRQELSGPMDAGADDGDSEGDESNPGDDQDTGDEGAEAPEPETDDEGAIVTKGYAPRRWTYADLAGTELVRPAGSSASEVKALERENAKLKKTLEGLLNDVEAANRRRR